MPQRAVTLAADLTRHHHHNQGGWGAIAVLMIIVAIAGIITARDRRDK